jgi:hypothetical protein
MASFYTKNPNLGKFWRVLQWKVLVYFMEIWSILWPFGRHILCPFDIFYGYLVYFSRLVCCTRKNLAALLPATVFFPREELSQHLMRV